MNFNIENPMLLSSFLSCDGSLRPLHSAVIAGFCGASGRWFEAFLPLFSWSARAQKRKSPCITIGICTFGRFGDGSALTGGGF
jgi:hypothetical protein